jgi:hypothetical protein
MIAVRYVALLALLVWLGSMITLGLLVAPATFQVLQGADPSNGRVLAGLLFGDILRRFHLVAYACGAALLISFFIMKFVGPPPSGFVVRSALAAAMLAVALYSGIRVTGELEAVQAGVHGPMSRLPTTDARRVRFDQLHRRSTMLMTINIGLGLVLLFWYVRE